MSVDPQTYGQGDKLVGQKYDPIDDIILQFWQRVEQNTPDAATGFQVPEYGTNNTELTPKNQSQTDVLQYLKSAIQAEFLNIMRSSPGKQRMFIPPELSAISLAYNAGFGDGADSTSGIGGSEGSYASLSLSLRSYAEGSASVMVEGAPVLTEFWSHNVPVQNYDMYFVGSFTRDDVIARLADPPMASGLSGITVLDWPQFQPQPIVLNLFGQEVAVRANASVQQQVQLSAANVTQTIGVGTGYSVNFRVVGRTITIPPTLHGSITIGTSSQSETAGAACTSAMTGGTNWTALSETASAPTLTATASVSPTSFAATNPSAVPRTGLYLFDTIGENYKWGVQRCRAVVVDASYFAAP